MGRVNANDNVVVVVVDDDNEPYTWKSEKHTFTFSEPPQCEKFFIWFWQIFEMLIKRISTHFLSQHSYETQFVDI